MSIGHYIYVSDLKTLSKYALLIFLVWSILCWFFGKKKWFRIFCILPVLISVYGILYMTVLGRTPTSNHVLLFASNYSNEFYRELFMNALLYFPLGLSLSVLAGPWTILAGFALSFYIEAWQYLLGTGTAQVTDLIMNTLGCLLGTLPLGLTIFVKHTLPMVRKNTNHEKREAE